MEMVLCTSWITNLSSFLAPDIWEKILWEENVFCYNDTGSTLQSAKVPRPVLGGSLILHGLPRSHIFGLFSFLFPLLFTLFTLCAYSLLQFWPEIAKGPSWEVSEPEPMEDIRIKLLTWMMSLKFFHGSRCTIILRKWNCEKELLNILITFIRLILYIKEFPLPWKILPDGTSLFVPVTRSLRTLWKRTFLSRCELKAIVSHWGLNYSIKSI